MYKDMISSHSKEAEKTFIELSKKMDEYVDSARIMDEQTYCV